MAESSILWTTGDTGDGATAYTQDQLITWLRRSFVNDPVLEGVLIDYADELEPTADAQAVTIAPGAGECYGFPYESTANVVFDIAIPTLGTTGHRIVLRADWTEQTVRLAILDAADGTATPPAVTQTSGVTWEISIATLTITTGGVITLTDTRHFCHLNFAVNKLALDDGAVTEDKIGDTAVSDGKIGTRSIDDTSTPTGDVSTLGNLLNWLAHMIKAITGKASWRTAPATTLEALSTHNHDATYVNEAQADSIVTAMITAGNVTTDRIADNAIDDTKAGNRVPQFYRRQGGDASDWNVVGTTDRTPTAVRMQAGAVQAAFSSAQIVDVAVTFPTAFSVKPIVFVTFGNANWTNTAMVLLNGEPSTTGFTVRIILSNSASGVNVSVNWLAIGTE